MSDVYQSEINPDDEPGKRLQEGLRGASAHDNNVGGKMARSGIDRRKNGPRVGDRRDLRPAL
jgi:hypothetical protein